MPSNGLIFEEALRYLENKIPMTADQFKRLQEEAKKKAFTVAEATRLDMVQDILDELKKVMREGRTLQDFQKTIRSRMERKGWRGPNAYRMETIFRTNMQSAYQAGRYKQMTDPDVVEARPYWMYVAVRDGATRPNHQAMNGMVRRYDDPIWQVWYPPNGFNCRCKVIPLSTEAAARRGVEIQRGDLPRTIDKETGEILEMTPDKGFANNVGEQGWNPDKSRYDLELLQESQF